MPLTEVLSNTTRAVDLDTHTADKGRFIAGQVQRRIRHIQRGGETTQRNAGQKPGAARFVKWTAGKLGRQTGVGVENRVDAVDADVVRTQLGGERFRQRDGRTFGRVVPGQARPGAQAGGGGDRDETAAALGAEDRSVLLVDLLQTDIF